MATNRRFAPFLRVLDRLTYPQKFMLISLLFLLPLAGFATLVIDQYERTRDYGTYEVYGTQYLRPLQKLLVGVQTHDDKVRAMLRGQASATDLAAVQAAVEQDLASLDNVDRRYGGSLGTGALAANLAAEWRDIKNAAFASEAESEARHAELVTDIRALITLVGNTSFLILDPDIDTYYVMDIVLLKMPEIQTLLGRAANLSAAVARRQSLSHEDLKALVEYTWTFDKMAFCGSGYQTSQEAAIYGVKPTLVYPYTGVR